MFLSYWNFPENITLLLQNFENQLFLQKIAPQQILSTELQKKTVKPSKTRFSENNNFFLQKEGRGNRDFLKTGFLD